MMKRWIYILMGAVLTALVVTACSGSSSTGSADSTSNGEVPKGATEIVMWNLFAGGDAEYMQAIIDKFNESQTDVFVKKRYAGF